MTEILSSTDQTPDWEGRYRSLVAQLQEHDGNGIYGMGAEPKCTEADKKTPQYRHGWNDASMAYTHSLGLLIERAEVGLTSDLQMLLAAGDGFIGDSGFSLNMNDTWGWALAWCPSVPDDQMKEVGRLFRLYGRAGLLYWHSQQEGGMRSEFHDINRMVDFVANEERIAKEVPDSNRRAYHKTKYVVGES